MIDKLDLRIPGHAFFTPEVSRFIREIDYTGGILRTRRSQYYLGVADLRPLGIDALLHVEYRFRAPHDSKLEILDVGKKSYSEMCTLIESVMPSDPDELGVMRLDLCADIPNVPVTWFQPRARFSRKLYAREDGELKYAKIGKEGVQTLTAGRRPNVFRIYDKPAESRYELSRRKRIRVTDPAFQSEFIKEFGFSPDEVLTRVERQMGGKDRDLLSQFRTFGKLRQAPDFNPFHRLELIGSDNHRSPTIAEDGFSNWMVGTRVAQLAGEMGMQQFRRWLNVNAGHNASRVLNKYKPYLPSLEGGISVDAIYEKYRESTIRQLGA